MMSVIVMLLIIIIILALAGVSRVMVLIELQSMNSFEERNTNTAWTKHS